MLVLGQRLGQNQVYTIGMKIRPKTRVYSIRMKIRVTTSASTRAKIRPKPSLYY